MERTANFNKAGFTLIEFLVAIVILMVGMLGLLQTVNYAIAHNMSNLLRQGAIYIADEQINLEKAKSFSLISSATAPGVVNSKVTQSLISGAFRNYSVVKTGTQDTTGNIKNVVVRVSWKFKQQQFEHTLSSLVSQYE